MKIRTLIVLIAALLTMASCHTSKGTPKPVDSSDGRQQVMRTVTVVLRISGAAHLADQMDPPVVILPNFTSERHQVLLVATPDYVEPGGLPHAADQFDEDDRDENDMPKKLGSFLYGEVPPPDVTTGVEIDLAASGVIFPDGTHVQMDRGDDSTDSCPVPFSHTEVKSLHWLPSLTKVSKATEPLTLKESFIVKDPDPNDVVSRLELRGGTLEAELTPQQRQFQFVIAELPAADDVTQTVSMSLKYTFTVEIPEGAPFVLKGRKFGTSGGPGDLVDLGRFKPDSRGRIELDLINMPPDDFFHQHDMHSIPHFHLHYRIVEGLHHEAVPTLVNMCVPSATRPQFECGPSHL